LLGVADVLTTFLGYATKEPMLDRHADAFFFLAALTRRSGRLGYSSTFDAGAPAPGAFLTAYSGAT
jgi:hypothetical protein